MTTRDEVAAAAATAPSVDRRRPAHRRRHLRRRSATSPRGQRAAFTIRVAASPRSAISGDPGVYWIGVHALGASADGRDLVADGRARTFIPLVHAGAGATPQRAGLRRAPPARAGPPRRRRQPQRSRPLGRPHPAGGPADPAGRLRRHRARRSRSPGWSTRRCSTPSRTSAAATRRSRWAPGGAAPERARTTSEDGASPSRAASPSATPAPGPGTPSEDAAGPRDQRPGDVPGSRPAPRTVLTLGYADPDVVVAGPAAASLVTRADDLAAAADEGPGLAGDARRGPAQRLLRPRACCPEVSQRRR